jgi:hypothetical protein
VIAAILALRAATSESARLTVSTFVFTVGDRPSGYSTAETGRGASPT